MDIMVKSNREICGFKEDIGQLVGQFEGENWGVRQLGGCLESEQISNRDHRN